MKKAFAILSAILILLLPVSALADGEPSDGGNLLFNGDFSVFSAAAELPAGWDLDAYVISADAVSAHMDIDPDYGRSVVIENLQPNDARVYQNLEVEPNAYYRISAMVRTASVSGDRGANLSIDNYPVDGTYAFSPDATGTSEWQAITMTVFTGPEQTQLRIALRLGGYGSLARGEAWFTGICAQKCEATEDAVDLMTENGAPGTANSSLSTLVQSGPGMLVILLAGTVFGFALFLLLYCRFWRDERTVVQLFDTQTQNLIVLLVIAFAIRAVLSVLFVGHSTDIACFTAWGSAVLNNGTASFYTSGMFADYPPGYMYVLAALAWIGRLFGANGLSAGYVLLYKLPATAAELVSAWLLYRLAVNNGVEKKFAVTLAALFALSPVLMFISGAWGQIDSILALMIAGSFFLLQEQKRILAGAVFGLAILLKPQALMFGPLLAVAYFAELPGAGWRKRLVETGLAVAAALAVIFLLSLPFRGTQSWDWIIGKYLDTAGSYPYISIEAFNLPALFGGNWKSIETQVLGVSYRVWGSVFIVIAVFASSMLYLFGRRENRGCLFLTGALMIVSIFTFGHYMHERYLLPALLLLLIAYVFYRDRRILLVFGWLSFAALLNAYAAMYIVDHQSARGALYNAITVFGSLLEVTGFLYFAFVSFDIIKKKHLVKADPQRAKQSKPFALGAAAEKTGMRLPRSVDLGRMRYSRKEWILLCALVLVYGVTALINLGSMKAPETYWESEQVGETVEIAFDRVANVSEYWVNGNIRNGGTLLISADGMEETFEQQYDDMFRWKRVSTGFTAGRVEVMLYSGSVCINEIAFFDETGALIPAAAVSQNGRALLDEQDTVPDEPLYFNGMYFDELYHGRTAYEHLHNLAPYENSHPPLGKLLISLGIAVFGMTPFGWRIVGALFGIGMLPVFYALSRRILRSAEYAFAATAMFAFDFMHFTQTRIATIDVYAVFFILVMYYFMYRYISMNFFVEDFRSTLVPLGLCGVFFGIGAACKWTCFYAGAGLAVLFFASLIARYMEYRDAMAHGTEQQKKRVAKFWPQTIRTLLFCCVFFLVIPFLIYYGSYLPYYRYEASVNSAYSFADTFGTFWRYQDFMYSYHSTLNATHSYQSAWYEWPFTTRPMWYYFTSFGDKLSTLTASGNPAVWWVSSIGAVVLLVLRLLRKIQPNRALQLIFVGILANYLPWVLVSRCTFIYHFFATVPFILLATVYLLKTFEDAQPEAWWLKWFWLGLVIVLFMLLYPGLSGYPVGMKWAAFLQKIPGGGLMYGA